MPDTFGSLEHYARERNALLDRIVGALQDDRGVRAVWLSGSFGRGEADEWADFDLHVAVEDEHFDEFLEERPSLYGNVGHPIRIQQEMLSNSMPGGRFQLVLYAGLFEVDWNIGPLSEALRPVACQMLLERAEVPIVSPPLLAPAERRAQADKWLNLFWAMASLAVKYVGRTETRRAVSQIALLSTAFIALSRLASQPEGPDPNLPATNRVLEDEIDARPPRLAERIDALAALGVIRELCAEVEGLHPALAALGSQVPSDLPGEIATLSTLAEQVARKGERRRRKYR